MAAISSGSRVDPFLMLASTIRWLSGGSIYDIAFGFKVAHQTVDAYKWRVMKGIKAVLAGNIRFPTSPDALRVCSAGFDQITRAVPNVIAAVDGVIFETIAPTAADFEDHPAVQTAIGQDYNRKGYFALTCLVYVDAFMRILSVSMTCCTSSHDSTLLSASSVGSILDGNSLAPHWVVVGDDAFKSRGHVLSPFAGHSLMPDQRNFNYFVSKMRCVVECAFSLWKGKWGIFWRPLRMARKHMKLVIETTARLHNFCIDRCVANAMLRTHLTIVAQEVLIGSIALRCA
jgi:hypothetical protein